jgi:hypothetical protein
MERLKMQSPPTRAKAKASIDDSGPAFMETRARCNEMNGSFLTLVCKWNILSNS